MYTSNSRKMIYMLKYMDKNEATVSKDFEEILNCILLTSNGSFV